MIILDIKQSITILSYYDNIIKTHTIKITYN